jgi:hypothetical protein
MFNLRFAVFLLMSTGAVWAQSTSTKTQTAEKPKAGVEVPQSKDLSPEEIIKKFSAKETEFYEAWMQYTYHQTAEVRVLSVNGMPKNEYQTTISDIVFKDNGTREVAIKRRAGDLHSLIYTPEDEEVINNLQPFALTEKQLPLYNLTYQGKEKVDELDCYVFSVTPKSVKAKKLGEFFEGKIWVDDRDLQVVRTVGKPVPQKKNGNQFPDFETIRQMVDKQYWFPVWTHAESQLHFNPDTVHIEETITYEDYKRFASKTTIQFEPVEEKPPEEKK